MYSPSPKAKRVEVRYPDPTANPYLTFAAMLMAGLDGIENKTERAYEARPERLYVIEDGKVTFRTGVGPYCYSVPKLRSFIEARLEAAT